MYVAKGYKDNELHSSREGSDQQLCDRLEECLQITCSESRCVKFADDEEVVKNVVTFTKHSPQLHGDLYWSRQEKSNFVVNAQRLAKKLRSVDPAHKSRVQEAFYNSDKEALPRNQHINDIQAISTWVDSEGRGLEHSIFPVLREEQKSVVRQTVLYHQYLSQATDKGNDEDSLRTFSENRTIRAREFAVKMAVADAITL